MKFKTFPAYGKELMKARMNKLHLREVFVVFDWKLARIFPRIVIYEGMEAAKLELRYLAGLDVTIAFHAPQSVFVMDLIKAILAVNPRRLITLNMDLPQTTVIKHSELGILL